MMVAVGAMALAAGPAAGQEHADGAEARSHSEHGYKNEVALFVGNTNRDGRDAFTVGFDYARELSHLLAVGVFFDRATGDRGRAWVLGVPLYIESGLGHLSFTLGAGVEKESANPSSDEPSTRSSSGEEEGGTLFMGRFGAQYPVHFGREGRLFVAPQANYDVTRKHGAWVLGVLGGFVF